MSEQLILSLTALVAALGVAVKNVIDIKELKKWICYRNPCPDRNSGQPDEVLPTKRS